MWLRFKSQANIIQEYEDEEKSKVPKSFYREQNNFY